MKISTSYSGVDVLFHTHMFINNYAKIFTLSTGDTFTFPTFKVHLAASNLCLSLLGYNTINSVLLSLTLSWLQASQSFKSVIQLSIFSIFVCRSSGS